MKIQNSHLLEETVILYSKLKQHKKALQILVTKMEDFSKAEQYCSNFSMEDPDLSFDLFKEYLQQKKSPKEFIPTTALNFLLSHAAELNVMEVLKILPSGKTEPFSIMLWNLIEQFRNLQRCLLDFWRIFWFRLSVITTMCTDKAKSKKISTKWTA